MKIKEYTKHIFEAIRSSWYMPVTEHQVYSTEERAIGTWIDGKPVYERTFTGSGMTAGESREFVYSNEIPDIESLVLVQTKAKRSDQSGYSQIPLINANDVPLFTQTSKGVGTKTGIAAPSKTIFTVAPDAISAFDYVITVRYTKTTDTATTSKVPFEPLHEWSTDEKLVGYWVNGKPVYGRTFTGTAPTYTPKGGQYVNIPLANIDEVIDLSGTIRYSTNGITGYMPLPFMAENSATDKQGIALYTVKDYSELADGIVIQAAGTSTDAIMMYNGQPYRVSIRYTKITD